MWSVDSVPMAYLEFRFGSGVQPVITKLRSDRDSGDPDGILAILNSNDRYDIPVGG